MSHATLGASGAYRWRNCPGSVGFIEREGLESKSSAYAQEGTAAHKLAALALEQGLPCETWEGTALEVKDGEYVIVDEEMAEAVQVYVDAVQDAAQDAVGHLYVEQRFDLKDLNPPGPMYGTADAAVWSPRKGMQRPSTLTVFDLKYGRGVLVHVEDNPQLMYYALGAVLHLGLRPDRIVTTVVQPRAGHPDGMVRSAEYTYDELVAFKESLFADARATLDPEAPLVVGSWCQFCPALAVCPAQHETALVAAQQDFTELPVPTALDRETLLSVMDMAPAIEKWLASIREHVHELTEEGEETGYKLIPKRGIRRWNDEAEAEAFLKNELGDDAYKRKLRSPAQAERALKDRGMKLPDDLYAMVSSGTKLAPLDDPRPAIPPATTAAEDFDPVTDEDNEETR